MRTQIYLYGFDKLNRVVDHGCLTYPNIAISDILRYKDFVNGDEVYVVDNTTMLKIGFWESVKSKDFTKHLEFKDYVERNGLRVR